MTNKESKAAVIELVKLKHYKLLGRRNLPNLLLKPKTSLKKADKELKPLWCDVCLIVGWSRKSSWDHYILFSFFPIKAYTLWEKIRREEEENQTFLKKMRGFPVASYEIMIYFIALSLFQR